jgi:hypothetical protein
MHRVYLEAMQSIDNFIKYLPYSFGLLVSPAMSAPASVYRTAFAIAANATLKQFAKGIAHR